MKIIRTIRILIIIIVTDKNEMLAVTSINYEGRSQSYMKKKK